MAAIGSLVLDLDAIEKNAEVYTTKDGKRRLKISVAFNSNEDQYGKNINSWYQKDKDSDKIWTGKGKITWVDGNPLERSSSIGQQANTNENTNSGLDDLF